MSNAKVYQDPMVSEADVKAVLDAIQNGSKIYTVFANPSGYPSERAPSGGKVQQKYGILFPDSLNNDVVNAVLGDLIKKTDVNGLTMMRGEYYLAPKQTGDFIKFEVESEGQLFVERVSKITAKELTDSLNSDRRLSNAARQYQYEKEHGVSQSGDAATLPFDRSNDKINQR